MKFYRSWLAILVLVVFTPMAGRIGTRYFALKKFLKAPGVRERMAIEPKRCVLTNSAPVHPVNLGYATFDLGSTNPVVIEASSSGAALLLTNEDFHIILLPPFDPNPDRGQATPLANSSDAGKHPHTYSFHQLMQTNALAGQMKMEEMHVPTFFQVMCMNDDDFLLYCFAFGYKGGFRFGADEVIFFESTDIKGIARIGEKAADRKLAAVSFFSPDQTKAVGFHIQLTDSSPKKIEDVLDPALRSFRFAEFSVKDSSNAKELIHKAGIKLREQPADSSE